MKIHRKVVSYFESCDSPVDKEGYLYKKGEIKTSYQRRWFVLKGNLLFYKDRRADRDPVGVIVLEGCTVQLCESEEQFAFSLVWSDPGLRTYKLAAEDQASQESWIKALLPANHNYLALLVMDLERKYREALGELSGDPANAASTPGFATPRLGYPASFQGPQASPLTAFASPVVAAAACVPRSNNPMLLTPTLPSKSTAKKSPKLWPKRSANVAEWSGGGCSSKGEFRKLHEEFGKEVKELIADWSKREGGGKVVQEEDLIDFG